MCKPQTAASMASPTAAASAVAAQTGAATDTPFRWVWAVARAVADPTADGGSVQLFSRLHKATGSRVPNPAHVFTFTPKSTAAAAGAQGVTDVYTAVYTAARVSPFVVSVTNRTTDVVQYLRADLRRHCGRVVSGGAALWQCRGRACHTALARPKLNE